jgi:malate synthase
MAAFIPSRRDPEVNELALARVSEDKVRESGDRFDGTWVAHPDLVPVAAAAFDRPNQLEYLRGDVHVRSEELLDLEVPGGEVTDEGLRLNVRVGIRYLDAWLGGTGAVAIENLMEDAATAEISRSQVWQWVRAGIFGAEDVRRVIDEELEPGEAPEARRIFEEVALADEFVEFLTLAAYPSLE